MLIRAVFLVNYGDAEVRCFVKLEAICKFLLLEGVGTVACEAEAGLLVLVAGRCRN